MDKKNKRIPGSGGQMARKFDKEANKALKTVRDYDDDAVGGMYKEVARKDAATLRKLADRADKEDSMMKRVTKKAKGGMVRGWGCARKKGK